MTWIRIQIWIRIHFFPMWILDPDPHENCTEIALIILENVYLNVYVSSYSYSDEDDSVSEFRHFLFKKYFKNMKLASFLKWSSILKKNLGMSYSQWYTKTLNPVWAKKKEISLFFYLKTDDFCSNHCREKWSELKLVQNYFIYFFLHKKF